MGQRGRVGGGVSVDGARKLYRPPQLRSLGPHQLAGALARAIEELALAEERARVWKAIAKRIWRSKVGAVGRYGCAAIDVRMKRHGR